MIIDSDDAERVNSLKWYRGRDGYFYTSHWDGEKTRHVALHHYLVGRPLKPLEVDHVNRDRTDNRKCNLRVVTKSQNIRNRGLVKNNTTGVTGVNCFTVGGKYVFWRALGYRGEHLGCFKTKEAAVAKREAYAKV